MRQITKRFAPNLHQACPIFNAVKSSSYPPTKKDGTMPIKHLGLTLKRPIEELRLTRENYVQRREDGSPIFSFGRLDDDARMKKAPVGA